MSRIPSTLKTSLVFAGGVGLGAYQAGAYAELHERASLAPDWIAASSVGAVNAAIIAGNEPALRVDRLQTLWSAGDPLLQATAKTGAIASPWRHAQNWSSAVHARLVGVQGHFRPRVLSRPFEPFGSFYDLSPLKHRVEKLVDFERLNSGEVRFCVATTDIETGELVVFDTGKGDRIGVEHLLASCGYLPEFQPLEIGGRLLGDGGLSANAPIEGLMFDDRDDHDRACFVVDLFSRDGSRPTGLESALARKNDLLFANQTRLRLEAWQRELELAFELERSGAAHTRRSRVRAIVHLSYRAVPQEAGPEKMFDLSQATANDRWREGSLDMQEALRDLDTIDFEGPGCALRSIRRVPA